MTYRVVGTPLLRPYDWAVSIPRRSSEFAVLLVSFLGWVPVATAQVNPDQSLGIESSIVTTIGAQDVIGGGAVRGSNLFHSFQDLNVAMGRSLFFANPAGISRIFGRITGGQSSQIFGSLGVLGNADLILINPNGIAFGPESRLALGGSFLGTTGDRIIFADGTMFSALTPESNALLTIAAPTGLQLGALPGAIVNQSRADGVGLTIAPLQTLALVGGDITLDGGQMTTRSGRIELVSSRNTVAGLSPNGSGFGLTVPVISTGSIQLLNQSNITLQTTIDNPNSQIKLVANRLQLQDQSEVRTVNSSTVRGADIDLQANRLGMRDGARFFSLVNGDGAGGDIRGRVANDIAIDGENSVVPKNLSGFYSNTIGNGTGGNIILKTGDLILTQGGIVMGDTFGLGTGGRLDITATQSIDARSVSLSFPGLGSNILTRTLGAGRGGDLRIKTGNLTLVDGAAIQVATFLDGPAGNLTVEVDDRVKVSGFNPYIPLFPSTIALLTYGSGRGGDLQLSAKAIEIENGASIFAINLPRELIAPLVGEPQLAGLPNGGTGDIGNMRVTAERITVRGINARLPESPSQLGSLTFLEGDAGDVTVMAREIRLEAGGLLVSSSVLGILPLQPFLPPVVRGDGGDLRVEAQSIWVDGVNSVTGLSSILGTETVGLGSSGDTYIDTDTLHISNGGRVSASTIAFGNAGNLVVNASQGIEVTGINATGQRSTLGTDATSVSPLLQRALFLPAVPTGNTGTLRVTTPILLIRNGGTVGVQHLGTGDSGTVTVMADRLRLNNGRLTAATFSGTGGNIDLQIRDSILLRRESQITAEASVDSGNGGNLNINTRFIAAPVSENSDIIANASGGRGGTITIRAEALLGLQLRDRLTTNSDITASSKFGLDGLVQIDELGFDRSPDRLNLPTALLDESRQIGTTCDRQLTAASSFVLTGRGGLPADPRDVVSDVDILQDWRSMMDVGNASPRQSIRSAQVSSDRGQSNRIPIEAQVAQHNSQGRIELIATAYPGNPIVMPTCITAQSSNY